MKNKLHIVFIFFSCLSFRSFTQTIINKITFSDTYKVGSNQLILNGGGTREKYWMDMYVGALYLPMKSKVATDIITGNNPMAIRICIVSALISSGKMIKAVDDGFEKSIGAESKKFQKEIEEFKKAFSDPIQAGDIFDIVYLPEKVALYKNNSLKIEISGYEFKKAVFGIWLGTNPADENLKNGLLGSN